MLLRKQQPLSISFNSDITDAIYRFRSMALILETMAICILFGRPKPVQDHGAPGTLHSQPYLAGCVVIVQPPRGNRKNALVPVAAK